MLSELKVLMGVWSGTTEICPSPEYPDGATFAASYTAQLDLAGRVLLGREVRRGAGRIVYQGLTVLGWDTARGTFTLNLFDTSQRQVIEPAFGEWRENALTLDQSRRACQLRFSYVFEDKTHCAFRVSTRRGEEWAMVLESRWERHGQ